MKQHLYLFLLATATLFACSKEKLNPDNLKDGQQVQLVLDHYQTGVDQRIFWNNGKMDRNMGSYIEHFSERETGYTYVVKARVVKAPPGLMDASSYWFVYLSTISKEKYRGNEAFHLPVFESRLMDAQFSLRKEADKFYYQTYVLTPADDKVKADLQRVWDNRSPDPSQWKFYGIRLKVTHDPANFGKGYKVQQVIFE